MYEMYLCEDCHIDRDGMRQWGITYLQSVTQSYHFILPHNRPGFLLFLRHIITKIQCTVQSQPTSQPHAVPLIMGFPRQ